MDTEEAAMEAQEKLEKKEMSEPLSEVELVEIEHEHRNCDEDGFCEPGIPASRILATVRVREARLRELESENLRLEQVITDMTELGYYSKTDLMTVQAARIAALEEALRDARTYIGTCGQWEDAGVNCGTCERCVLVNEIEPLLAGVAPGDHEK